MWLDLVGLRIDVADSDAATRRFLREQWPEFVSDDRANGDVDLRLRATVDESILGQGPAPEATIRRDEATGDYSFHRHDFRAQWRASERVADLTYIGTSASLSSFTRVLVSILLRARGGVLFHAASVRTRSGETLLFPGISGTGKSTIASLATPRGILSDEISALRPTESGGARAYPTPFWGDLVRSRAADAAPLGAIVLLRRGGTPVLESGTSAEAFAALLEGALFFEDPSALGEKRALVAAVQRLATSAPCRRLRFALPANPWELLDAPLEP